MREKGFAHLILLLAIVVAVIGGIVYWNQKHYNFARRIKPQGATNQQTSFQSSEGKECPQLAQSKDEVFNMLSAINHKPSTNFEREQCFDGEPCISDKDISEDIISNVAVAYGIVTGGECKSPIYVHLRRGVQIENPGIGTGYMENQRTLGYEDDKWYWTVNACSNNNRVILDAISGEQMGPIHKYTICGGVY